MVVLTARPTFPPCDAATDFGVAALEVAVAVDLTVFEVLARAFAFAVGWAATECEVDLPIAELLPPFLLQRFAFAARLERRATPA